MDFPNKLRDASKESVKYYLERYIMGVVDYIKKNGYVEQVESIDAFNELINRVSSNKTVPFIKYFGKLTFIISKGNNRNGIIIFHRKNK
jgi:hypothetical protein